MDTDMISSNPELGAEQCIITWFIHVIGFVA